MGNTRKKKRRNRNRRRRRRRAEQRGLVVSKLRRARLRFEPTALEVAAGHDGLLRGHPEPAVILAAYSDVGAGTELMVRTLFRYDVIERPPCRAKPRDGLEARSARIELTDAPIIMLVVAIEEDGGRDLEALYSALDDVEELVVWPLVGEPVPCPLSDVPSLAREGHALQVGLQAPGGPPIDAFRDDDYVGTAALWVPRNQLPRRTECTASIRSKSGDNDWTVRFWLTAR